MDRQLPDGGEITPRVQIHSLRIPEIHPLYHSRLKIDFFPRLFVFPILWTGTIYRFYLDFIFAVLMSTDTLYTIE